MTMAAQGMHLAARLDEAPRTNVKGESRFDLGFEIFDQIRDPERKYTQEEIAAVVGCSRGYIYLIEKQALAKLRKALNKRGWSTRQ